VGYSTIMWVYLGWYAGVRVGFGKYRIPEAVMVILVGVFLGWITGLNSTTAVKDAAKLAQWSPPQFVADELFAGKWNADYKKQ
jgi:adenine/guanine/hypoxanthine permease